MRQLVKLPDVLLTDDEDAAYLREGDVLAAVLGLVRVRVRVRVRGRVRVSY